MRFLLVSILLLAAIRPVAAADPLLGLFRGHTDIGSPAHTGTVAFDAATGAYTVGGGGANMWFKADSFHYVWQEVKGDLAIEADPAFPEAGGNNHRKGFLMIRQSLDLDSAYVDVAVHGDGLTSLQFREAQGEVTHEVQALAKAPSRVRLEKIGDYVYLSLPGEKGAMQPTGCSARVAFKAPFYVGIGVCAHDDKAFETVRFTHIALGAPASGASHVRNSLEYVKVPSGDRVCVYPSAETITAAAWGEGTELRLAQGSRAFRISAPGGALEPAGPAAIPAQPAAASPDGKWTASLEHQGGDAVLTLRPTAGGETRVLMRLPDQADAPLAISWSADSAKIAYVRVLPR